MTLSRSLLNLLTCMLLGSTGAGATCIVTVAQGSTAAVAADSWANPWETAGQRFVAPGRTIKLLPVGDMVLGVTGISAVVGLDSATHQPKLVWVALEDGRKMFPAQPQGLSSAQVSAALDRWAALVQKQLSALKTVPGPDREVTDLFVFRFAPGGGYQVSMDGIVRSGSGWKLKQTREGVPAGGKGRFLATGSCAPYFPDHWQANGPLTAAEFQQVQALRAGIAEVTGDLAVRDAAIRLEEFATRVDERRAAIAARSVGPPFEVLWWDEAKKGWLAARVTAESGKPAQ
jgi:hypothetical protein